MSSERSRSPSPPLEVHNHSVTNENHVLQRTNSVQYNSSHLTEVNTNSSNSLMYSNSVLNSNSDDKISQILKEVNSLPSLVMNHNNHEPLVHEQKPMVSVIDYTTMCSGQRG